LICSIYYYTLLFLKMASLTYYNMWL
jgi:hypothetical protein